MTFLLNCSTPTRKHRWILRSGERARIGSSPWVEFTIDDDEELADVHLSVRYSNAIVLHSLGEAPMEVDGQAVSTASIQGKADVHIGKSVIRFEPMQGHGLISKQVTQTIVETERIAIDTWEDKQETLSRLGLSPEGVASIASFSRPDLAIEALMSKSNWEDALRLLAGSLPVIPMIQWGIKTLLMHEISSDPKSREQAIAWGLDPSEPLRLEIAKDVPWTESGSPWTWILASISWTGGSLGPTDQALISPPQKMIVSAMIASFQLASCQTDRAIFYEQAVFQGMQILAQFNGKENRHATSRADQ